MLGCRVVGTIIPCTLPKCCCSLPLLLKTPRASSYIFVNAEPQATGAGLLRFPFHQQVSGDTKQVEPYTLSAAAEHLGTMLPGHWRSTGDRRNGSPLSVPWMDGSKVRLAHSALCGRQTLISPHLRLLTSSMAWVSRADWDGSHRQYLRRYVVQSGFAE